MAALVWLRNAATGGVSRFPEASVPAWQAKGWEPCDPPAEVDPAMVEHVPLGASLADPNASDAEASELDDEPEE